MHLIIRILAPALAGLLCSAAVAQQSQNTDAVPAVPNLIRFAGSYHPTANPPAGPIGATFAIYAEQEGGTPLWTEEQNIQLDADGNYSVLLGAAKNEGVPLQLFPAGEARWVQVKLYTPAEVDLPRVLLVSVPYAMKAGDAATVGGLPPSAFLLAAPAAASPDAATPSTAGQRDATPAASTGTQNYIPIWTDSSGDLGNSVLYQSGTGATAKIGINITTPATTLDVKGAGTIRGTLTLPTLGVATATTGYKSQPLDLAASAFNSGTSTAVKQTFQWQAEPVGNDTAITSGSLNLLYASGTATPAETGLRVGSNGVVTFASSQTFPGAGTITGVTAGTALTGGGTSGPVTLNLDTAKVPLLNAPDTFTGLITFAPGQTFPGTGTITGVTAGTALTGGGTSGPVTLNLDTAKVPLLNATNTFTGNQSVTGNVTATGSVSGATISGGQLSSTVATGTAPLVVSSTTQVPNLNASLLGGLAASSFQPAGSYATLGANNFNGNQSITGNVSASGTVGGSVVVAGSQLVSIIPTVTGIAPLQVNSTVQVANLNASYLGGYSASAFQAAGTVPLPYNGTGASTTAALFNITDTAPQHSAIAGNGAQALSGNYAGGVGVGGYGGPSNGNALASGHGGAGVFAQGGTGAVGYDTGGAGVDAHGGAASNGLGGAGIIATGGNGAIMGGDGIDAFGGSPGTEELVGEGFGSGIYAEGGSGGSAGYFYGDVAVAGHLSKSSGSFKIDHPLDPANKYLYHSFVESPDMKNIYDGNVVTDGSGTATVTMPAWFEALNSDFRYQLTVIGQFAQAIIASEISNGSFTIQTDKPNVKVSWQVTGIRQDAWAKAHRIQVEVDKAPKDQGHYIHPELFGHDGELSIAQMRHPRPHKP